MNSLLERLQKRKEQIDSAYNKLIRQAEAGILGGEEDRLWMDQFTKGFGLDLCCGDFKLENSVGIDSDPHKIGSDLFFIDCRHLTGIADQECDFIACNYLDCFPNTIDILTSWKRTLKKGGRLILVVRNADAYTNLTGPLENSRRQSLYTSKTLSFFLNRTGFKVDRIETFEKSLRCLAILL